MYGNLKQDDEGIWVKYVQAKQRGEQKENKFLVPFDRNNAQLCLASRVVAYLRFLELSLPGIKADDDLFRQCLKDGFGKHAMGRNLLAQVGKEAATEIGLEEPARDRIHQLYQVADTNSAIFLLSRANENSTLNRSLRLVGFSRIL
jgi:hypothetical protein